MEGHVKNLSDPYIQKKYIDSDGSTKEFVYRTVATLNNISVVFESVQIPVNKIGNNGTGDIFIQVEGDYATQLLQVQNEVGADNFSVYLFDPVDDGYNYSALYRIYNIIYNDGKTQFYLKNIDNNAAAFLEISISKIVRLRSYINT